jgi:hypothetical protein
MATVNLFLVTQTLQRLIDLNVRALLFREGLPTTVSVTAMPPERVGSETHTINIHLYHVMEDPHYKNLPTPPGAGHPPVARQPLVLMLYYIVTTHHEVNDVFDAETQQLYLGLAMKTLHDHPIVVDTLAISPDGGLAQTVMPPALSGAGNRLEISLRPLTPEEALGFWSAEQTSTARLAAYYEVRTIFLQPEPPLGARGTVFDVGLFVSAGQAPRLDRVAGLAHFTPPPATGLGPQAIETVPARATLAPGLPVPVNRIELRGTAVTGDGQPGGAYIVLRSPAWRLLTPPVRAARIDPALNPLWAVELDERGGRFDLQGTLIIDDGGGPVSLEVTPGIFAVSVETIRRQETQSGITRVTTSESNQIAFSVGARIAAVDPPNVAGRMVLRVVNVFDMQTPDLEVQLAIDGILYDEVAGFTGDPAQDRGLFERQPGAVEFHPLFDPATAGTHPVRLVINSAESQPFWIVTP